jgi:hypothetical protein
MRRCEPRSTRWPPQHRTGCWLGPNLDGSSATRPALRTIRFSMRDCGPCPSRNLCTRAAKGRRITLRPREEHEALLRARTSQGTDEWQERYATRAGVEGTIAQGVKGFGLRRSRYRGTAKTHLQHLLIAAAMNLIRIDAWLTGTPLAPTRTSHFAALRPAA